MLLEKEVLELLEKMSMASRQHFLQYGEEIINIGLKNEGLCKSLYLHVPAISSVCVVKKNIKLFSRSRLF